MSKGLSSIVYACSACGSGLVVETKGGKMKCVDCGSVGEPAVYKFLGLKVSGKWVQLVSHNKQVRVACPLCRLVQWVPEGKSHWLCDGKHCGRFFGVNPNLV